MDLNFRRIDIDRFDEDAIQDSEVYQIDARNPADVLDQAKQRQIAVRGLLAR
jgi:actin related protein 2/3 complex subunit 5